MVDVCDSSARRARIQNLLQTVQFIRIFRLPQETLSLWLLFMIRLYLHHIDI